MESSAKTIWLISEKLALEGSAASLEARSYQRAFAYCTPHKRVVVYASPAGLRGGHLKAESR
jgi:hypothetical protein